MSNKHECVDCNRYVPNEKYDPNALLSAEGYCRIPVRDTGGLLGTVEAGEGLNIFFARTRFRCDEGRRWFVPKDQTMTALFIPLKTEFFEAFRDGTKDTEYRPYGPRWNERTCAIGRPVVLSKGYGKAHRLIGRVVGFTKSEEPTKTEAWRKCYGDKEGFAACIKIKKEAEGS